MMMGGVGTISAQTDTAPTGYKLVWSDEFNGDALDEKAWNIEVNGDGGGNQELQFYRRENVAVKDGNLVLTARRENYSGKAFTSGRITSRGKAYFKHGVMQARIKFPKTKDGLWPAYWMMGNDITKQGWPKCGEMDIIELGHANGIANGTQDRYFAGTLHYGKSASNEDHQQKSQDYTAPEDNAVENDDYHIFTVTWDGQNVEMYYDLAGWKAAQKRKAKYFTCDVTASDEVNSPGHYFQKPFFFLFNLAVGGTFPGIYDASRITALPNVGDEAQMMVDWVRVYQAEDDADAQYATPDSTNIPAEPVEPVLPDSVSEYGYWGSAALDANGKTTFDFANAKDAVLIGTSQGVTEALSGSTTANYNVDEQKNFLYIWSETYSSLPSEGVNSFGFEESFGHYQVNSIGWSGLGYASSAGNGKDLSMLNDDYILHFAMRGTDAAAHASQEVTVGTAKFTLGRYSLENATVIGDYKRDGSWTYFDIPVKVLKTLAGTDDIFEGKASSYEGNVFAVLSGGTAGTDLQFDNVFFYKNDNVVKSLPTTDNKTPIGPYASKAVENDQATLNLDNVKNAVLIATSTGVTEALTGKILKDYRVDEKNNFFWIWDGGDYTGMPSEGKNSMGWDEESTRLQVAGTSTWDGAGFASQNVGKDLSMIDDTYYLHFAMRGTDVLQHASQTVTVGNAVFVIGNSLGDSKIAQILGDYRRNGDWYNFDIPVAKLRQLAGGTLFGDAKSTADAFLGNAFAVSTTHQKGNEVNFDQVFFYQKADADTAVVLPTYVTKALDADGKTTFDIKSARDVVLIGTSMGVTEGFNGNIKADYNVDDVKNYLYIWSGTLTGAGHDGENNSFGYAEGYTTYTVGTAGWSGLGYASQSPNGKDLSMLDDSYILHFAMKRDKGDTNPYLLLVGNAKVAIGGSYTDNGTTYPSLADLPSDGEWYNFDIPFSEFSSRASSLFDNKYSYSGNVFAMLAGGTTGKTLTFDNVFFYKKGDTATAITRPTTQPTSHMPYGIYTLAGRKVNSMSQPGIYIVKTAEGTKKIIKR